MTEKIQKITQNTVIPLSFVFVLAGAVFWLSRIHFTAEINREAINEMKVDIKTIDRRTATIQGLLTKGGKGG